MLHCLLSIGIKWQQKSTGNGKQMNDLSIDKQLRTINFRLKVIWLLKLIFSICQITKEQLASN